MFLWKKRNKEIGEKSLPGEKLSEALFREGEVFTRSKHEKIFVVADPAMNGKGNGHAPLPVDPFSAGAGIRTLDEFEQFVRENILSIDHKNTSAILEGIKKLVPEFVSLEDARPNGHDEEHVERA